MSRLLRVIGAMGSITRLWSFGFLVPAVISWAYDPATIVYHEIRLALGVPVFLACFAGTYALGLLMRHLGSDHGELQEREAFLTVGLGWLWMCALAMIPFLALGPLYNPIDAFFEAMSGMTTTGATVIPVLEGVAPSLHIWRGFLQFVGGMGIIVLSVALLAKLTQGGRQMLQAESPGPSVTRIAPRIAQTARFLWGIYLAMGAIYFVVLFAIMSRYGWSAKTTFYEALMHTLTTVSTGGFSNHTASLAHFDDVVLEVATVICVLVSGTNFTLLYYLSRGQARPLLKDPEWRFFMTTMLVATLALSGLLVRAGQTFWESFRDAAFTTASMGTSTGFATADFGAWPAAAQAIIVLLMVTGATAGSTSGGMKHVRILLIGHMVRRQFIRILHPHAVVPIRIAGRVVQPQTMMAVVAFFVAFVGMWLVGTVLLVLIDPIFSDPVDAASASIAALSNMGPGLGVVGPREEYAALTGASKILLSFEMWFGRLELFTAMLVFSPGAWRN